MEFSELIKNRYSVRRYKDTAVEKEKLEQVLQAGRVAPTGKNAQPQRIIAVQSSEGLDKVSKAANAYGAPVVLIVCADKTEAWCRPYDGKVITDIDASIVTVHMMLQAAALGLGTVWICAFKPDVVRAEFNIPDNYEIVNLLAVGYAADDAEPSERHSDRKPLSDTVTYA